MKIILIAVLLLQVALNGVLIAGMPQYGVAPAAHGKTLPAQLSLRDTQVRFEQLASEFTLFCASDFLYDRPLGPWSPAGEAAYREARRKLFDPAVTLPTLIPLLHHRDPRVRTLAIAAVFAKQEPRVMPDIAQLLKDEERTIPCYVPTANLLALDSPYVTRTGQTVGSVARSAIAAYLQPASFKLAPKGRFNQSFDSYWMVRKDRQWCASWIAVNLIRATDGVIEGPLPPLTSQLAAVRDHIYSLPARDRAWTLLWLSDHFAIERLATVKQLTAMTKALGHESLLALVEGRVSSDDPDIKDSPLAAQIFVLRHARELLQRNDSIRIERLVRRNLDGENSIYDSGALLFCWRAIAAAELDPARAKHILRQAYRRFQYDSDSVLRSEVLLSAWRTEDSEASNFVIGSFYDEKRGPEQWWFLREAPKQPHARELFAGIIQDPRLDRLNGICLGVIVGQVQEWTKMRIADLADSNNPYSTSSLSELDMYQTQEKQLIKQARQIRAKWLKRLRESVPRLIK